MMAYLANSDIARLVGISDRHARRVTKKLEQESRKAQGRKGQEYPVDLLPDEWQQKISAAHPEHKPATDPQPLPGSGIKIEGPAYLRTPRQPKKDNPPANPVGRPTQALTGMQLVPTDKPTNARNKAELRAMAKNVILNLVHNYGVEHSLGLTAARQQWRTAYADGTAEIPTWVTDALRTSSGKLPAISTSTLCNWLRDARQGQLADQRQLRAQGAGGRGLTELHRASIRSVCYLNARRIHQLLRERFPGFMASQRTVQRYLKHYAETNPAGYGMVKHGSDWYRNNHRPRIGSATASVTHINQRWEMDATIADVILSDGKRHTIMQLIDVHSRRMVCMVGSSSNSQEYGDLIIKALIKLGVPEELYTDNGKAESSVHIDMLCKAVGISKFHCGVRQPQQKPFVERHFRTLNDMLFSTLPGYCGKDVAERKAIRAGARGGLSEGQRLSREEFQGKIDNWLDNYYEQQHKHGGLQGLTPIQAWNQSVEAGHAPRFIENLEALRIAASPVPANGDEAGIRTVTAKGISVGGHSYISQSGEQVAWQGRKVFCRWFPGGEASVLMVFDPQTDEYLFLAHCFELVGSDIRKVISTTRDAAREQRKAERAERKAMEAELERRKALQPADLEKVVPLVGNAPAHTTPKLDAYAAAAEAQPKPEPRGGSILKVVEPSPKKLRYDWDVLMPQLVRAFIKYRDTKDSDNPINPPQDAQTCRTAIKAAKIAAQKGCIRTLLEIPLSIDESYLEVLFIQWLQAHADAGIEVEAEAKAS